MVASPALGGFEQVPLWFVAVGIVTSIKEVFLGRSSFSDLHRTKFDTRDSLRPRSSRRKEKETSSQLPSFGNFPFGWGKTRENNNYENMRVLIFFNEMPNFRVDF